MSAQWYYARNNQQHGPYSDTQLKQLASSGQLQPTDMVHRQDMQKWIPAGKVKGLFPTAPGPVATKVPLPPPEGRFASAKVDARPTPDSEPARPPRAVSPSPGRAARPVEAVPVQPKAVLHSRRDKRFGQAKGPWQKLSTRAKVGVLGGGAGVLLLIGLAVLAAYLLRNSAIPIAGDNSLVARGQTTDKPKTTAEVDVSKEEPRTPPDFSKVDYSVDFSKVDYSPVDFSKLDYTKGPKGQPIDERQGIHPKAQNDPYSDKAYTDHGFLDEIRAFVRHGVQTTWYVKPAKSRKGKPFEEVSWFDGQRHGSFVHWDKNGNKTEEGFAVNGKLHGKRTTYYPSGEKELVSYWLNGEKHGTQQEWHKNGQMMTQGAFVKGKRHGRFLYWHPNGAKSGEEFYIGGKLHGPLTAWHPNGQKKVESAFVNGKEEARRLEWYENGQKETEVVYIDGLAQGKKVGWHLNGKKEIEGVYKDDKEVGLWTFWNPDGSIQNRITFYAGTPAENEEVYEFVKRFAKLNRKTKWTWAKLSGNAAADILGRPQPLSPRWNKHKFVVYEIAGFRGGANSVFSVVGEPDLVLPTLKDAPNQEWVFYRGNAVIRCLVLNVSALKERRLEAKLVPGDDVNIAAPGLLVGGDRDF